MKYLKGFFIKIMKLRSLNLLLLLSAIILNSYAIDIEISKSDQKDISVITDILDKIDISNLDREAFKKSFPLEYQITPFILEKDLIMSGIKISDNKYIFLKSNDKDLHKDFENAQIKPNILVFPERIFEHWLLLNITIFNKIKESAPFLLFWCPNLTSKKIINIKAIQSYIFHVKKPEKNCTLAAVVGEDRFFPDVTEEENELNFFNLPVLYYTSLPDLPHIFVCHIQNWKKLKALTKLIGNHWADQNQKKLFIRAFKMKRRTFENSNFEQKTFFNDLKKSLGALSQKYDFSNIGAKFLPELIKTIQNFLISNGISSFSGLKKSDKNFKLELADRFFTAKTTAFFRDWREMVFLKDWFNDLDERTDLEGRPIKIKVFGCSTGQEVLSYAFELLENGIDNFRILATDIDPKVLNEAKNMTYEKEKFITLPSEKKTYIIENYFEQDEFGNYRIRFDKFFNDRIHFMIQDITLPLRNDIPEEFKGPYDLVSVKNILLYLDDNSVQTAINNLKNIIAPKGILVLRDKRNKASDFLDKSLNKFIGITDVMILKESGDCNSNCFKKLMALFEKNPPPSFVKFFYNHVKIHGNDELKNKFQNLAEQSDPENLGATETLLDIYKNKKDIDASWSTLKKICPVSPVQFLSSYSKLKEDFSKISPMDPLLNKCLDLLFDFSDSNYRGKTFDYLKKEIQAIFSSNPPVEVILVICDILSSRDSGRFAGAHPSNKGQWIKLALDMMDNLLKKEFSKTIFDFKLQILNKLFHYYPGKNKFERHDYLIQLIEATSQIKPQDLSLAGKIAGGHCFILFANLTEVPSDRIKAYSTAIKYCQIKEEKLKLLSDRFYGDYYTVLYSAYSELALMQNSPLSNTEKNIYIQTALTALEKGLAIKTVYGYREINLRKKLLKK